MYTEFADNRCLINLIDCSNREEHTAGGYEKRRKKFRRIAESELFSSPIRRHYTSAVQSIKLIEYPNRYIEINTYTQPAEPRVISITFSSPDFSNACILSEKEL